ncbi:MAG: cell division protein FtsZ [Bacteroides sp. SM23_62_1]|nr:MAG: cell division protein FtsZ [Bacteroides sp. SM23_62_1]
MAEDLMNFDMPVNRSSIIKVLGIGGGGSNAVNYMWRQGINDVDFVVCNTDAQALNNSPVSVKIQIGESLTEGRGAGNKPEIGRQAALENLDDIVNVLSQNTKMVFLTAGMGGGTGTGAAPVIAKAAQEMGILTVAIVTIPFRFEGQLRINQAIEGINELEEYVDSLLVINNEKLREIYGDLKLSEAFARADTVLTIAAKGIAEIITVHGYINVDFADVETVMKKSGVAILGSGTAAGEGRALKAIQEALSSPLLNNNDITGADSILLNITSGLDEVSMDEVGEITDYVTKSAAKNALIIWGTGNDPSLNESISVTIIATGFETNSIPELYIRKKKPDRVRLVDDHKPVTDDKSLPTIAETTSDAAERTNIQRTIEFDISGSGRSEMLIFEPEQADMKDENGNNEKKLAERVRKLRDTHERFKGKLFEEEEKKNEIDDLENEPAYIRKKIKIENVKYSSESKISKYSLSEDEDKNPTLREDNSYLHDNVD